MPSSPPAFRVLLVDQTNTQRSAAGERLFRNHLKQRGIREGLIRVTSAGLDAVDGTPLHDLTRGVIERYDGNAHGFVARSLNAAMVAATDLFICGVDSDREELIRRHPRAFGRSFTFAEIGELYRRGIKPAPLVDHPAILERQRRWVAPPTDFDLPPWALLDERVMAAGAFINQAATWAAEAWAAIAPVDTQLDAADLDAATLVDAFGVPVAIAWGGSERAALMAGGKRAWRRCLMGGDVTPEVAIEVHAETDARARTEALARGVLAFDSVDTALHHLTSAVTVRAIESRAGGPVMLHAAGMAAPDGRVAGFVAPSGTGKTTLARTIGAHYGYVTDETLAIEPDLTVRPYPKPLSVIDPAASHKEQWSPESLDLAPVPRGTALKLSSLSILHRDPELEGAPVVQEVALLEGLAVLAEQVSYLARLPRKLHSLADVVEQVGGLQRVTYRDSRDLLPLMPALLAGQR